jgi:hypothetical protein
LACHLPAFVPRRRAGNFLVRHKKVTKEARPQPLRRMTMKLSSDSLRFSVSAGLFDRASMP